MTRACWVLLALIHVLPGAAFLRPALITSLYGVGPSSDAFVLLQHRAALFLVVAVVCVSAALQPETRRLGAIVVALSMLSFLLQTTAILGQSINRVELASVEVVLRPALTGVGSADFASRQRSIEAGRAAMQAALPRLRAELAKMRPVAGASY